MHRTAPWPSPRSLSTCRERPLVATVLSAAGLITRNHTAIGGRIGSRRVSETLVNIGVKVAKSARTLPRTTGCPENSEQQAASKANKQASKQPSFNSPNQVFRQQHVLWQQNYHHHVHVFYNISCHLVHVCDRFQLFSVFKSQGQLERKKSFPRIKLQCQLG